MGTTKYQGRAESALLKKQHCTFWVAIARTSVWPNEQAPPSPSPGDDTFNEPICFVRADNVRLCRPVSEGGDIVYRNQPYEFVDDAVAVAEHARYLYMHAEFHPAQGQPYGPFREISVFSNLVPKAGHENDLWLSPTDVASLGVFQYQDFDVAQNMSIERYEVVPIMIEFK